MILLLLFVTPILLFILSTNSFTFSSIKYDLFFTWLASRMLMVYWWSPCCGNVLYAEWPFGFSLLVHISIKYPLPSAYPGFGHSGRRLSRIFQIPLKCFPAPRWIQSIFSMGAILYLCPPLLQNNQDNVLAGKNFLPNCLEEEEGAWLECNKNRIGLHSSPHRDHKLIVAKGVRYKLPKWVSYAGWVSLSSGTEWGAQICKRSLE